MKIKKIISLFLILIISASISFSQKYVKVKKSLFNIEEDGFRDAWKQVKKGNKLFRQNKKGAFAEALPHYNEAWKYNNVNAALNYLIGICYLKTGNKAKAKPYIDKAYSTDSAITKDILFWKAVANHYNSLFEEAIDDYNKYAGTLSSGKLQKVKSKIDKKIRECENGKKFILKPERCFIENIGKGVNTEAPEYSPVFFLKDSMLLFTSRRENTTRGKKNPVNKLYYEDVYMSIYKDGVWGEAQQLMKPVNTKHNDAVVEISHDGMEICIYRGHKGNGDLYNSKLVDSVWHSNKKMKKINTKKYRESSVSISADGMTLFFISDRKGGVGGQDIWFSNKTQNKRKWQTPQNIGDSINTKYDEETVDISSDGKTLYFSSKGHNSMGGYDVFKVTKNDDGTWNKPVNMGSPINTPDDDLFFMITQDDNFGYYTSNHEDGLGDKDIYKITFLGKEKPMFLSEDIIEEPIAYFIQPVSETEIEKPVDIKIIQLSQVKGIITNAESGEPIEANIELIDNDTGELIKSISSYSITGSYTVPLPPGKDYAMTVEAKDYLFHSENFYIADTSIHEVIKKDIKLQPMGIGIKIVLNNVSFDTGKSTLKSKSFTELDRVVEIIKKYPTMKVEISGHTDDVGSATYNQKLSQKRAQAVVDYIIGKNIKTEQIIAKGYGESKPRADNKTEEGRQINRRVEAKIISN